MRVGLLGWAEVLDDDGRGVVVAGAKLRALLAGLAMHVGRVVPTEQSSDAVRGWRIRRRLRNGPKGSPRRCDVRWAADSWPCGAAVTRSSCRRKPSTCTGTSSSLRPGQTAAANVIRVVRLHGWRRRIRCGGRLPWPTSPTRIRSAAHCPRLSELRSPVIEERNDLELSARSSPGVIVQARGARRRASAARAPTRPAHARVVPGRSAGRRAPRLSGRSSDSGRRARGSSRVTKLRQLESDILVQDHSLDPPPGRSGRHRAGPFAVRRFPRRSLRWSDATWSCATHAVLADHRSTLVGPAGSARPAALRRRAREWRGAGVRRLLVELLHVASDQRVSASANRRTAKRPRRWRPDRPRPADPRMACTRMSDSNCRSS